MTLPIDRREELRYLHCEVCLTTESIRRFIPRRKKVTTNITLPDHLDPEQRSLLGLWNDARHLRDLEELQAMLEPLPLSIALQHLFAQQTDSGFIVDDLSQSTVFQRHSPEDDMFLLGQYNPVRLLRFQGVGRKIPPAGMIIQPGYPPSCFICTSNIGWQSKGVQLYYRFPVNGNEYAALCNPFPFMPKHITVASAEHRPQSWHGKTLEESIQRLVTDLYDISAQLPGWVCFYNGDGAGASIKGHFHYQIFQTPRGHGLFPIQHAAKRIEQRENETMEVMPDENAASVLTLDAKHYPLAAFRITGNRDSMIRATIGRLTKWSGTIGNAASANLIAIHEHNHVTFYFVPRNHDYSRSGGLTGIVGGLEALGEILFCTEKENDAINTGRINYQYMWDILKGVTPPNIGRMMAMH